MALGILSFGEWTRSDRFPFDGEKRKKFPVEW